MSQVSRPMQVLLAVTLLFAAAWFVALRPKPHGDGGSASAPPPAAQTTPAPSSGAAPGVAGLKSAIDKAHGAVATADADARRAAQSSADGTAQTTAGAATAPGSAHPATSGAVGGVSPHAPRGTGSAHRAKQTSQLRAALAALRGHKALAIAFYDPNTADARAVADEIRHVSTFGGRAATLAVPLAQLADYDFITNKVQVTVAPTVVIVDGRARATTIVGFADRGEIEQRLADALAAGRR